MGLGVVMAGCGVLGEKPPAPPRVSPRNQSLHSVFTPKPPDALLMVPFGVVCLQRAGWPCAGSLRVRPGPRSLPLGGLHQPGRRCVCEELGLAREAALGPVFTNKTRMPASPGQPPAQGADLPPLSPCLFPSRHERLSWLNSGGRFPRLGRPLREISSNIWGARITRAGVRLFKNSASPGSSPGPWHPMPALAQPGPSGASGLAWPSPAPPGLSAVQSAPAFWPPPSLGTGPALGCQMSTGPGPQPLCLKQHGPETQTKSQV